jgi:hypothetical protein
MGEKKTNLKEFLTSVFTLNELLKEVEYKILKLPKKELFSPICFLSRTVTNA